MRRFKIICLILTMAILSSTLAACGSSKPAKTAESAKTTESSKTTESAKTTEKKETSPSVSRVSLEVETEGSNERAVITGLDKEGGILWSKTTDYYPCAQLDSFDDIGIANGLYYYIESGDLVTLDLSDGSEKWRCGSCGHPSAEGYVFDKEGNLYLSGFLGPDLCVVDKMGSQLFYEKQFTTDFYWPYKLQIIDDSSLHIYYDGIPGEFSEDYKGRIILDLHDYSIKEKGLVSQQQTAQTTETPETTQTAQKEQTSGSVSYEKVISRFEQYLDTGELDLSGLMVFPGHTDVDAIADVLRTEYTGNTVYRSLQEDIDNDGTDELIIYIGTEYSFSDGNSPEWKDGNYGFLWKMQGGMPWLIVHDGYRSFFRPLDDGTILYYAGGGLDSAYELLDEKGYIVKQYFISEMATLSSEAVWKDTYGTKYTETQLNQMYRSYRFTGPWNVTQKGSGSSDYMSRFSSDIVTNPYLNEERIELSSYLSKPLTVLTEEKGLPLQKVSDNRYEWNGLTVFTEPTQPDGHLRINQIELENDSLFCIHGICCDLGTSDAGFLLNQKSFQYVGEDGDWSVYELQAGPGFVFGLQRVYTSVTKVSYGEYGWNKNGHGTVVSETQESHVIQTSGQSWQQAYYDYLLATYSGEQYPPTFALCYIDEDDIPEVVVGFNGVGQFERVSLYTYYGGNVCSLGEAGTYSTLEYVDRGNFVLNRIPAGFGYNYVLMQRLSGGKLQTLYTFEETIDGEYSYSEGGAEPEPVSETAFKALWDGIYPGDDNIKVTPDVSIMHEWNYRCTKNGLELILTDPAEVTL